MVVIFDVRTTCHAVGGSRRQDDTTSLGCKFCITLEATFILVLLKRLTRDIRILDQIEAFTEHNVQSCSGERSRPHLQFRLGRYGSIVERLWKNRQVGSHLRSLSDKRFLLCGPPALGTSIPVC